MSHPNPNYGLRAHQQHPQPARTRSTARASSAALLCIALTPAAPAPRAAYAQTPPPLRSTPCYSYAAPLPPQRTCPQLQPLNLTTLCRNLACRPSKAASTSAPRVLEPELPAEPAATTAPPVPAQRGAVARAAPQELTAPRIRSATAARKPPLSTKEPRTTRAIGPQNSEPKSPNLGHEARRTNTAAQRPTVLSTWQLAHAQTQAPAPQLKVSEIKVSALNPERTERCAEPDSAVMSIVELK